jgi:3-polyprenyl-4-hydroxybenzoate decarboxylase
MAVRTCRVTCRDAQGVEHTVQVTAQSLFEAVAQALRVFREHDWSAEPNSGSASVVVTIKPAEVEHRVRIKDFQIWLESAPRSPAEMALKRRLREILGP